MSAIPRWHQIENQQIRYAFEELAERVKALEEAHISTSYTYADGAKQLSDHLAKASQPKPAPAPDLETVIDNAISRFKTVRWEIAGGLEGPKFRDLLRAFAAELGVK